MSRPRSTDPTSLSTTAAAEAIRHGELTSEALVTACLDRIAAREGEVQAWEYLDPELALAQARDADAAFRAGEASGALHGVPVGIKDIFDTADMPTENGSPIFSGRRPDRDATCVAALRSAGAVIIGKTVTTELALLTPAKTRNPHNLAHTPGGSSAGSAAAVADHMVPAGARQPDRRLDHPPGVVLRRLRLQADARPRAALRRADAVSHARYRRRLRPLGRGSGASHRLHGGFRGRGCNELPPQPARPAQHGARQAADAATFCLRQDAGLGRRRSRHADGAERVRAGPGRARRRDRYSGARRRHRMAAHRAAGRERPLLRPAHAAGARADLARAHASVSTPASPSTRKSTCAPSPPASPHIARSPLRCAGSAPS